MSTEVNVPDEAVKLAAEQIRTVAAACCQEAALAANVAGSTEDWMGEAQAALKAAAPRIVAADYEAFAAELRGTLHNLPEYTHGSLAWTVMNAIDAHIEDLRGDR